MSVIWGDRSEKDSLIHDYKWQNFCLAQVNRPEPVSSIATNPVLNFTTCMNTKLFAHTFQFFPWDCLSHPAQHVHGSLSSSSCNPAWMLLPLGIHLSSLVYEWSKGFSKAYDELFRKLWMLRLNVNSPNSLRSQFNQKLRAARRVWAGDRLHLVAGEQGCRFRSAQLSHLCWKAALIQVSPKTALTPAFPCDDPLGVSKETKANSQLQNSSLADHGAHSSLAVWIQH